LEDCKLSGSGSVTSVEGVKEQAEEVEAEYAEDDAAAEDN
jgi:hypothetical protein